MTRKSNIHGNTPVEDTADAEYADAVKEKDFDTVSKMSRGSRRNSSYKNRLYKALRSSSNLGDLLDHESKLNDSMRSGDEDADSKPDDEEAVEGEGDEEEKEDGEGDDLEEDQDQVNEYEDAYSQVLSRQGSRKSVKVQLIHEIERERRKRQEIQRQLDEIKSMTSSIVDSIKRNRAS